MQRSLSILLAALLVFHPVAFANPPSQPDPKPVAASTGPAAETTTVVLENGADVTRVVDDVLRRLSGRAAGAPKPVVLLVRDDRVAWDELNRELVVALSRYGLDVEGLAAGSSALEPAEREVLSDIAGESLHQYTITAQERGRWTERMLRRLGRVFGMQQGREHFARLRDHYEALAAEERERREAGDTSSEPAKGDFRFEFVKTVPRGFGGGPKAQATYLFVAGMNTLTFALASPFAHGLPELLVFALTYLYQGGQFYVNYLRQGGRAPRWELDPTTGHSRLVADKTRTYTRGFFFAVTFSIIAAANLLIMTPLLVDGSAPVGWTLWRILTNSLLGVFAFAPVEALIGLRKDRQSALEKEATELEQRLTAEIEALSPGEKAALERELASVQRSARGAEMQQLALRNGFIGVFYPFIKNFHFLGQGWSRAMLFVMGSVGFLIDLARNGRRLHWRWPWWLGGQRPAEAVLAKVPSPAPPSCATELYLTTQEAVARLFAPKDRP